MVGVSLAGGGHSLETKAVVALLAWWALAVAIALGAWPRAPIPRAALVAGACLTGLVALSFASTGWASDDGRAFAAAVTAAAYLGLFWLVVLASKRDDAGAWLGGLATGLVALGLLALGSRLLPDVFPDDPLGRFIPNAATRLSYPLDYWNALAAAMAFGCVLLVGLGAAATTRLGRALAVAAVPVPAAVVFLTSSRGGVVAGALGCVALLALARPAWPLLQSVAVGGVAAGALIAVLSGQDALVDGPLESSQAVDQGLRMLFVTVAAVGLAGVSRYLSDGLRAPVAGSARVRGVVAVAAVAALAGAAVAIDPAERWDRFREPPPRSAVGDASIGQHLASGEGSGRYQFWQTAWEAFEDEPLRGIGAGGYESWWARHGSIAYPLRNAHSLFFEVVAELGAAGLILLLAFFGSCVVAALPRLRSSALAGVALAAATTGIVSTAIDWTWQLGAATVPLVVVLGLLAGPATAQPDGRRRRLGRGPRLAAAASCALALVPAALALTTEDQLDDSREAARDGDLDAALEDARGASAAQPWAAAPHLQVALVYEQLGARTAAREEIREAIDRAPEDWRLWLVDARLAVVGGDVRGADRSLARARALNPRSTLLRLE